MLRIITTAAFILLFSLNSHAERDRLYSSVDPTDTGGIKGSIVTPSKAIVQILAIPPDEPRLVYVGQLLGTDKREFLFEHLPIRKYDLVVIYDDEYYEGLNLHRGDSNLNDEDQAKIKATVDKAEKYFLKKTIHRLEGESGRGKEARCIVTYLRDKASTNGKDYRRSLRLIMLKDVGPGWQIVRTRDLYPTWTKPVHANPTHHYVEDLGRIRVTSSIKDIGGLRLSSN